jgi:2,5-diketo-D-gluconate reductase B
LNQSLLIEATRKARLAVTGYCGMAVGPSLADPLLAAIVVPQGGVVAPSRTTDPGQIAENVAIFDFERVDEDTAAIHALVMPVTQSSGPPRRVTAS